MIPISNLRWHRSLSSTYLKRYRRLFLRLRSPGNRKDTRRLRFSFFQQQCQSAGSVATPVGIEPDERQTSPRAGFPSQGGRLV